MSFNLFIEKLELFSAFYILLLLLQFEHFSLATNSGTNNLRLRFWKNSEEIKGLETANSNNTVNVSISYPYNEGDNFRLACIILGQKFQTGRWKLEQSDNELLVTKNKTFGIVKNWYEIIISPDRNDNNLVAICETSGTKKIVKVKFSWNTINDYNQISKDNIEEKKYTAGQPVPNTLDRYVIVYNNKKLVEKFIKPNSNIYDRLAEDSNQTLYSAWFEGLPKDQGSKTKLTLYKKYSKIIVLPINKLGESSFLIVAVVTGTISLFVTVIFAFWIYHKYVKRRQTCDNSEHIPLQVTYAEINLKAANRPLPPVPQEPYATIIGVVQPKKISTAKETPRTRLPL